LQQLFLATLIGRLERKARLDQRILKLEDDIRSAARQLIDFAAERFMWLFDIRVLDLDAVHAGS
jgi:hypothetical protein